MECWFKRHYVGIWRLELPRNRGCRYHVDCGSVVSGQLQLGGRRAGDVKFLTGSPLSLDANANAVFLRFHSAFCGLVASIWIQGVC
jgi:hypothetical protein